MVLSLCTGFRQLLAGCSIDMDANNISKAKSIIVSVANSISYSPIIATFVGIAGSKNFLVKNTVITDGNPNNNTTFKSTRRPA